DAVSPFPLPVSTRRKHLGSIRKSGPCQPTRGAAAKPPKRGIRSLLLGRRLLQQVMDAAQRKQIGMLYLIDGRRLTRSTSSSATGVTRAPHREQRSDRPSDREIAVLQLVADGFANREIGLSL